MSVVREYVGVSERTVTRAFQVAIVSVLLAGVATRHVGVVVNAAVALAITFLPAVLERDFSLPLDPGVTLWITVALSLHAVGMLGIYTRVWWWDHLTHTLSATVVAAVGYATARVLDEYSDAVHFTRPFLFVYILLFTVALGVFWEVLEFLAREVGTLTGHDPVLYQYGVEDTVVDLVFDTVGAIVVALFGSRPVSSLVETFSHRIEHLRDESESD
ncbi:hypothetical protein ACFQPA_13810 [Halomarina halobia]|uniref:DUF2238 domain-containing protein n=1 Tax=Halomarina halobia TaxID=3033386 RepID=A0ABD6A989_9EURY|nr:hypothetical protein [Halomarina sp. PSR21]